jgi:hypothetical protein
MVHIRRTGVSMIALGICGAAFFWLADPRYGALGQRLARDRMAEAVHSISIGTQMGLAGSLVVLSLGLWLITRRQV